MELKEQLINDLNDKSFLYYPCCGMHFSIIPSFLNYFQTIKEVRNFIFIDANNDNTRGCFTPIEFLGNKLGLAKLEIVDKETYVFDANFYSEIGEILNDFQQNDKDRIRTFINGIQNPKVIRFVLKHGEVEFILYYFYFEALTIMNYINLLPLDTNNRLTLDENFKGLMIQAPGGGWTDAEHLSNEFISLSKPQYIVKWDNTLVPEYGESFLFPAENNLWISFQKKYGINTMEEADNVFKEINWKKIK